MSALAWLSALVVGQAATPTVADRIHLHGWVDVCVSGNARAAADGGNFFPGVGTTAKRANELSVNAAAVSLSADPAPIGATFIAGIGTSFEVVHQSEPLGAATGPDVWQFLQQASVTLAPTKRLLFELGVYPSHIGFETFVSKDDWNYTRGYLADLSPYYQAGLRTHFDVTDHLSVELHLLNGWQIIGDNNRAKAIGTQLAWKTDRGSLVFNTFAGPELPNDNVDWRFFGDLIGTLNLPHSIQLAAVIDAGLQQRPSESAAGWGGVGLSGRIGVGQHAAIAGRAELYRDAQAVLSGASQTLTEGTLTLELRPWEPLIFKVEGRYDHSTAPVFNNGRQNQWLGVLGCVATL